MRENAVRRLPVMDDSRIVGMVALGELAVERDEQSALAGISAARPMT
jgi:CBS domain-containing protein